MAILYNVVDPSTVWIKKSATPSNCGDVLKLQLPNQGGNTLGGRVNDPGYGKNVEDITMDNPQPSSKAPFPFRGRSYECSSQTKCRWVSQEA
jgi:hypothetical protein